MLLVQSNLPKKKCSSAAPTLKMHMKNVQKTLKQLFEILNEEHSSNDRFSVDFAGPSPNEYKQGSHMHHIIRMCSI